jgi:hypothetical protein
MRVEDMLAGARNWSPWKARMVFVLEDLELWDIVEAVVPPIPVTNTRLSSRIQEEEQQGKDNHMSCCERSHYFPLD